MCIRDRYNVDPAVRFFATPPIDGCLCETVNHPAAFTYKLPDNVSSVSYTHLDVYKRQRGIRIACRPMLAARARTTVRSWGRPCGTVFRED